MTIAPTIEVRNPLYQPGHPEEIERVTVRRALRDDPLARLHAARRIGDSEYRAGREMQRLLEAAEVGHVGSMDTTREPVDGSHVPRPPVTDRQLRALKRLTGTIYPLLGKNGSSLVQAVLAKGQMPEDYARSIGVTEPREVNSIGRELRRQLALLAREFGYA